MKNKNLNIALVGLGPHAKRVYLHFLKNLGIEPKLIVDLVSQKSETEKYLNEKGITATVRRELGSDIEAACGQLRRQKR